MEKNSADSAVRKKRRILAAFLLLAAAMAAGILLNICIGSVSVSLSEILKILSGQPMGEKQQTIILQLRLPRTILAAVLGGALALSGYLLQTFFHNPIAGPFVLGISSGAKMVVALVMVFFLGRGRMVNSAGMIAAAFAGAMLSMGFVLLMSRRIRRMSMLVVSGVMIGYICSAVTELVVTFAQDADIVNLHNLVPGQLFRNDLEQRQGGLHLCDGHFCAGVSDVEATVRLSAWRIVCVKSRCECEIFTNWNGRIFKYSVRVRCGLRRTDLLCRDRSPAAGQKNAGNRRTDLDDPGQLSGGQCFLSVL